MLKVADSGISVAHFFMNMPLSKGGLHEALHQAVADSGVFFQQVDNHRNKKLEQYKAIYKGLWEKAPFVPLGQESLAYSSFAVNARDENKPLNAPLLRARCLRHILHIGKIGEAKLLMTKTNYPCSNAPRTAQHLLNWLQSCSKYGAPSDSIPQIFEAYSLAKEVKSGQWRQDFKQVIAMFASYGSRIILNGQAISRT